MIEIKTTDPKGWEGLGYLTGSNHYYLWHPLADVLRMYADYLEKNMLPKIKEVIPND